MARKIEVQIVGDSRSLQKALGQATSHTHKFGSVLSGALKVGAGAAVAGFGALAVATKIGIDEFGQSQRAAAQTAAVLKSTGGAANVTAGQVDSLATSLLNKTGIDDEVIKSGENMLLTFRNIRNEAGKGNDVFTQTTKVVTDLSVGMGEDMKSASIQVGKALNDPIKGLTSLSRVGVQFTDGQKASIKAMVDSGHTMQAQKVILKELNKEFGGSAEAAGKTLPGQLNILKETFRNTAGEVVGSFMPLFVQLAKTVLPLLAHGFAAAGRVASQFAKGLGGGGKGGVAGAGRTVRQIFVGDVIPAFRKVWAFIQKNVIPIVQQLRSIFTASMRQIGKVVSQHGEEIHRIAVRVGAALQAIATVAIPILRFVLVTVLPKAIGIAIQALDDITRNIAAVIGIVKRVAGAFRSAFNSVKGVIQSVINTLDSLMGKLGSVADKVGSVTGAIGSVAGHIPGFAGGVTNFSGGLAVVGEKGPELLRLPRGSDVFPNHRAVMGGGGDVYVTVELDGQPFRALVKAESRATSRSLTAGKSRAV